MDWDIDRRLMPGLVPGRLEVGRNGPVSVWVSRVEVYPNGINVTLRAVGDFEWHTLPPPSEDRPVLTVTYADGRSASGTTPMAMPREPQAGPLVLPGAAGASGFGPDGGWGEAFVWPFPDDGDLTLTFDYQAIDVRDVSVVLDGDALRAAASRIVVPFADGAPAAVPAPDPVLDSLAEAPVGARRPGGAVLEPAGVAVELARSDDVALWAGPFAVGDEWAEVEVRVLPRDRIPGFDTDDPDFMFTATRPEGRPRFGVVENGRLCVRGGASAGILGPTQYRTGFHIDPLPADGTITIATDWPALGVPESQVTLDVAALRA